MVGYLKTKILLSHFLSQKVSFKYTPIDISEEAVKNLVTNLKNEIPGLHVKGRSGDYFDLIKDFSVNGQTKKIILFLGFFLKHSFQCFDNPCRYFSDLLFLCDFQKRPGQKFHNAFLDSSPAFTNQYLWAYYGYFSGTDDDF